MNTLNTFLEKHRDIAQLAYGIVLVVGIPTLIAVNSVFIIKMYGASIDETLRRHALATGGAVGALIKADLPWEVFVQAKLDALAQAQPDILEISVLAPEGDGFKAIASTRPGAVGAMSESPLYRLAWAGDESGGVAVDSAELARTGDDAGMAAAEPGGRYWLVARAMSDLEGRKVALLAIKQDSRVVDELMAYNRRVSLYLLAGTLVLVIAFLLVIVRLWDYAALYRKAREIDQLKNEFVSLASHELKAPITGISGYLAMAAGGELGPLTDKLKAALEASLGASRHLASLVDDLLDVGRIEQGRIDVTMSDQDPGPAVKEALESLSAAARQKGLELKYLPHRDKLPKVHIDRGRFKQVLINILSNSIKYTEKGTVEVATRELFDGRVLEIEVRDTGIGMAPEERDRLFEKFYRVQNDRTRKIAGTGLGLWISRELTHLMGGKIAVESIVDVGTQIAIQFPVAGK